MFRAMYQVGGSRPEDGAGTVDHIVAVHARKGDHDNVVDLARSIRRARWDQMARGRRRPSHDVVSASLSPARWAFVVANVERGIDNADPDDAVVHAITKPTVSSGD
jgi:hypothetical protein